MVAKTGGTNFFRWLGRLLLMGLIGVIAAFYFWTVAPEKPRQLISSEGANYYNLLSRGFLKGELSLDVPDNPILATLANPYDPGQRAGHGMHDASYFKGKFYLYFGITPALVLFVPFKLLTGWFVNENLAVLIFAIGGFLSSYGLFHSIAKAQFPGAGLSLRLAGCVALGLATMVPALLRRPGIWEVPIACGYFCFILTLYCVWRAMNRSEERRWLLGASLMMGLAVGARPVYLFGSVVLLAPLARIAHDQGWGYWKRSSRAIWVGCVSGPGRIRVLGFVLVFFLYLVAGSLGLGAAMEARPWLLWGAVLVLVPLLWIASGRGRGAGQPGDWRGLIMCAMGPVMAVGLGLALYNFLRFNSALEFGQTYQMAGEDITKLKLFGLGYVRYNLWIYLFSVPGLTPYFPFLTVITVPLAPMGQFGIENPYGLLPGMPWVVFALVGLGLAWRRCRAVDWWCGAAWAGVVATAVIVCCFGGATGRYQVDFTPGLVLLGAVSVLAVSAWLTHRLWRALFFVVVWGLALWSAGFNVLVSLQHNRLLLQEHRAVYASLAHTANHISWWYDRLTDMHYGPVDLRVAFPTNANGQVEPLVATGREFLSDYVYVHYVADGLVRFGFEHTNYGGGVGRTMKIAPGAEHVVRVQMGSLYPPEDHPANDGRSDAELQQRLKKVLVSLDGRVALTLDLECYDATDRTPSIGTSGPHRPAFKRDFSGRIVNWSRVDRQKEADGPLRLTLQLAKFTGPINEPLLCSGETGKGDLIFLVRVDERHIMVGHDRWGYGGSRSEPIAIDPEAWLDIEISCPPLLPSGAPSNLVVKVGDVTVLDVAEPFHPSRPDQVFVGANPIGSSMSQPEFKGVIVGSARFKPRP